MADIMDCIAQTDEWAEIQTDDPGVRAAEDRWRQALEGAKAYLPRAVYNELSDANCGEMLAYSDVAILYGMRVASIIQALAANPAEITRLLIKGRNIQ